MSNLSVNFNKYKRLLAWDLTSCMYQLDQVNGELFYPRQIDSKTVGLSNYYSQNGSCVPPLT